MEKYEHLGFKKCEAEDIPDAAKLMFEVFRDELALYHLPEKKFKKVDEEKLLTKYIVDYKATAYCVYIDDKFKGIVLYWVNSKESCGLLGEIYLATDVQNCGIGQTVWKFVLSKNPEIKTWRAETPLFARRALNFFVNKLGFKIIEIKKPKDELDSGVVFELKVD